MIKSLMLGAALAIATPVVFAQVAPITQFFSPSAYKTLSQDARDHYVAGVLDAESAMQPQGFAFIRECVKTHDVSTIRAAVDHFMESQPAGGNSMPINVHNATLGICKQ